MKGDNMDSDKYDRKKASALARQVGTDFGASMTVALAYVGDRLGLFKALAYRLDSDACHHVGGKRVYQ